MERVKGTSKNPIFVIPAKAGIQFFQWVMDPDFRRDDVFRGALKRLGRAAFKVAVCIWIAGCGSPATDVGNPTIPIISQLVGTYGAPSTGAGGTDSPATDMPQASATPACQYDATQERQITAGSGADEVILANFLSYSDSAKTLPATYSAGVLSATLVDDTISMVCTGTVALDGSGLVSVSLTCDLDSPVDQTCGATLERI